MNFRLLIASIMSIGSVTPVLSAERPLCVREVPFVLPAGMGQYAHLEPKWFQTFEGTDTVLVRASYHSPLPEDTTVVRSQEFFWRLDRNVELVGPNMVDFHVEYSNAAVSPSGDVFAVGGRHKRDAASTTPDSSDERAWETQLLRIGGDGAMAVLNTDLPWSVENLSGLRWDQLRNGLALNAIIKFKRDAPGPGTFLATQQSFLVKDGHASLLDEYPCYFSVQLPGTGATVCLDERTLSIAEGSGPAKKLADIHFGFDRRDPSGLYALADEGWVYARGGDYDNAVRLEHTTEGWRATEIVRVEEERSLAEVLLSWMGLTSIESFRTFSEATGRMFSRSNDMREFRDGKLVPLAGGLSDAQYLGDAKHLGLAVFLGPDGQLYGYDGTTVEQFRGEPMQRGIITNLPRTGSAFLSTRHAVFELVRTGTGLSAVKLSLPEDKDYFFTRTLVMPGSQDLVLFVKNAIYRIGDGGEVEPIFSPNELGPIEITGGVGPVVVPSWDGVLFMTKAGRDAFPKAHLLTTCGEVR